MSVSAIAIAVLVMNLETLLEILLRLLAQLWRSAVSNREFLLRELRSDLTSVA